jgi:hypothetical protein
MIYKLPTRDWLGVDDSRFQQKIQLNKRREVVQPLASAS